MRASAIAIPLFSLPLLAACGANGELPGFDDEHPCKAENHCLREDGESVCESGYQWENPDDEDNYNCVLIPAKAGRVDWGLPSGGHVDRGFYQTGGGGPSGSDNWSVVDLDGDGLPDLVVPGQTASDGNDYGFGFPNDPHWRVYKNTGSGFATQSSRFALPSGGHVDRGFYQLSGGGPSGSDNWALVDMDGDRRPDLVVTGQCATDGNDYGFGFPSDPHWRVYKNTGSGFADEPTRFKLPAGGHVDRGFYNIVGGGPSGSHNWSLLDMNGDGKLDLVVPGQTATDGNDYSFGFPNDPHWRIYVNDGSRFVP